MLYGDSKTAGHWLRRGQCLLQHRNFDEPGAVRRLTAKLWTAGGTLGATLVVSGAARNWTALPF